MRQVTVPQMAEFLTRQYRHDPTRALFFWGPPGVGKTMVVKQVAEQLEIRVKETRIGTMVPSDLRGVPVPDQERKITEWFTGEYLPDPDRDGERGILLLDEYPQATPVMQGLAQRLVLERRMGERYEVPPGWMVVALGNRREDRASVYEMPAQTQNRFKHFLVMPDVRSFTDYALTKGFHPHILSFLNANQDYLHMFDAHTAGAPAWPSPRTWEAANEDYLLGEDPADLEQNVGSRAMHQFQAFLHVLLDLPDVDAILAGEGVKERLPSNRNAHFALITTLASRMRVADEGVRAYKWLAQKGLDNEMLQVFLDFVVKRSKAHGSNVELATMLAADDGIRKSLEELLQTAVSF